jgi:hypothetical protein
MAVISMFYGVIVSMYFIDTRRNRMPHIHVRYQDRKPWLRCPAEDCSKAL